MTTITRIGLLILFTLMFGISCTSLPKSTPLPKPIRHTECVPDVQLVPQFVSLPAELTQSRNNPSIPTSGDNETLLNWCLVCASNNAKLNDQMNSIRDAFNAIDTRPGGLDEEISEIKD